MGNDITKQVKIDELSFQELMLMVKNGNIRIPNFQREFVWELNQIISLLDSIYHHYPIGSFLFWETDEHIETYRTIGDVKLNRDTKKAIYYVLDGQQRITSLFASLEGAEIKVKIKGKTVKKKLEIYFDLDEEEFVADPFAKSRRKNVYKAKRIISFPNQTDYMKFLRKYAEQFREFRFSKNRICQWSAEILDRKVSHTNYIFNDCCNWKLFDWKNDHLVFGKNNDVIYDDSPLRMLHVLAKHFAWFEEMFEQLSLTPEIDDEEFRKIIDEKTEEDFNDPWYMRGRLKWLQGLRLGVYKNGKFSLSKEGILLLDTYHKNRKEEIHRQKQLELDYQQRYISVKTITEKTPLQVAKGMPDNRYDVVDKVITRFGKYPFSIIYVIDQPVDVACDIFERINNSGQILKLVDLMVAKSYSPSFNMRDRMYHFFNDLEKEDFGDIPDVTILQCMAAILGKSIKRRDILLIDRKLIWKSWDNITESIKKSIDYLKAAFNLTKSKILPYNNLVVPLAYYFFYNKDSFISDKASKELQLWFWKASFSNRYDSAVETKIGEDLIDFDKILKGKKPNFDYSIPFIDEERIMNQKLNLGSAFCKSILCLLNQINPVDFVNNTPVKLNSFSKFNSAEFHHIFPQAYLKKHSPDYLEMKDSIVNISIASASLNKKYRDKAPSEYLDFCRANNSNFESALKSHLISSLDNSGLMENDFGKFLSYRSEKIAQEIQSKIGKLSRIEIEMQKDEKGVIDEFEAKMRKFIKKTLESKSPQYWEKLEQDFRDRIETRINSWLTINPTLNDHEVNKLDFCQVFDYFKIIKKNWINFETIFSSKSELEKHFQNINEFRNSMMHSRETSLSTRKLAEGSLIWFDEIFIKNNV